MKNLPDWIPIYFTVQRPGDVIVTSGFHQGFSLGLNFAIAVNFALDSQDLIRCLAASTCTKPDCKMTLPALALPWKSPIQSLMVPPLRCSNPLQNVKGKCEKEWTCSRSLRDHYKDVHREPKPVIQEQVKYSILNY